MSESRPCKNCGFTERYAGGECATCARLRAKQYRLNNPEKTKSSVDNWRFRNKEKYDVSRTKWAQNNPIRKMVSSAKKRAKNLSIPFDLNPSDLSIPEICPVLGIAITQGVRDRMDSSPSIDRIVPSLGYTKDNVRIISWRANRLKSDATPDELRLIANDSVYSRVAS